MKDFLRLLSTVLAVLASLLAIMPWLGKFSYKLDALSSFLPVAAVLAVIALAVGYGRSGWAVPALAAVALILCVGRMAPEWLGPHEAPPRPGARRLTIVTHNLEVTNRDMPATIGALKASGADVLLLQEADRLLPYYSELAETFPYHSTCREGCDPAIFSRIPFRRVYWKFHDNTQKLIGPPLFWAELQFGDGSRATIASYHAPWPFPGGTQAAWRGLLINAVARIDSRDLILAGDFNLTPWGEGMRQLDDGLIPLRRVTHGHFTFPARVGGKPWPLPFLPIDQMFVGPAWDVVSVERLPRTGSDHFPLKVTLARTDQGG